MVALSSSKKKSLRGRSCYAHARESSLYVTTNPDLLLDTDKFLTYRLHQEMPKGRLETPQEKLQIDEGLDQMAEYTCDPYPGYRGLAAVCLCTISQTNVMLSSSELTVS